MEGWDRHDDSPFVDLVGPVYSRAEGQVLHIGLYLEQRHCNTIGIAHGGLIATILDRALGLVVQTEAKQATMSLSVAFVDAAQVGEFLESRCHADRVSGSHVFASGEIWAGTRLIATGSSVLRLLRSKDQ